MVLGLRLVVFMCVASLRCLSRSQYTLLSLDSPIHVAASPVLFICLFFVCSELCDIVTVLLSFIKIDKVEGNVGKRYAISTRFCTWSVYIRLGTPLNSKIVSMPRN